MFNIIYIVVDCSFYFIGVDYFNFNDLTYFLIDNLNNIIKLTK